MEEIPDGAEIAVPNDPTNESRALYLLQAAGLIKVGVSGTELATIADITENKKNLKITELDASQTASSLSSVDAAVVNNTFVLEAGLITKCPLQRAKDENSKQWYNLIAARSDWEKSEQAAAIKKIIEAYHTDEVKKLLKRLQTVWMSQFGKM